MNQAKSLTGIYERQVLDNLAMFSQNPDALPFFAIPKAGSAQVTDSGAISASPLNGPIHTALSLTSLSRGNAETWTLEPVSDPAKLRRMRCAYRRALGYSFKECNKCCQLQEDWENKKRSGNVVCCEACKFRRVKVSTCSAALVHKPCEKVGSYCGTHIRLCDEPCSKDAFTQLVLDVLDYAVNAPAGPYGAPQMEVEHYHYLKIGDELMFDNAGRPIIDSIDKFQADAHEYVVEVDADVAAIADQHMLESEVKAQGKRLVKPTGRTNTSAPSSPQNRLLEGAIDQLQRDTLFLPSIPR